MKQLITHLDYAAQLVGGKRLGGEVQVGFLNGCTFLNPGRTSVIHRNRDGPRSRLGVDNLRQASENIILLKALKQLMMEFIRDGIASVLVHVHGDRHQFFGSPIWIVIQMP